MWTIEISSAGKDFTSSLAKEPSLKDCIKDWKNQEFETKTEAHRVEKNCPSHLANK